jgi:hypothetical protein
MDKAPDFLFAGIQETEILAAVNDLVPFPEIFSGKGCFGIAVDITRQLHHFTEAFRTGAQSSGQ